MKDIQALLFILLPYLIIKKATAETALALFLTKLG